MIYHHSINAVYFDLTEKIETYLKASKCKVNVRVRVAKSKNIFSNGYTEN